LTVAYRELVSEFFGVRLPWSVYAHFLRLETDRVVKEMAKRDKKLTEGKNKMARRHHIRLDAPIVLRVNQLCFPEDYHMHDISG
jgi:hypothetical protein